MNDYMPTGGDSEAAELFPHYAQEDGASAETILLAADDIEANASPLDDLSADLDAMHQPAADATGEELQPLFADNLKAAKDSAAQVLAVGLCASGATRLFATDGVRAYDNLVDELRDEYAERRAEIMSSDCGIDEVTYPENASTAGKEQLDRDRDDKVRAARDSEIADLVAELQQRQETYRADPLDSEAGLAATRLEEGPTDEVMLAMYAAGGLPSSVVGYMPHLDFKLDDGKLPSDLAEMSDEELAEYVVDHPELAASLAGSLNDEVKQMVGEKLAHKGNDIKDSEGDLDPEELEEFATLVDALGDDEIVATSFLNEIGPRGLLELNARVATLITGTEPNSRDDFPEDLAERLGTLQSGLGALLAAGTREVQQDDHGSDAGGIDHVSAEWIRQLCDAGREQIETGGHYAYGYQLLGPLLGEGEHSSYFLNRVGEDMLRFEQQFADEHDGMLPWEEGPPSGIRLDWTHGYGDDDPAGRDPMVGLMGGLANNPDAAREFFVGERTYSDGQERLPRVDYLLTDRVWPNDYVSRPEDGEDLESLGLPYLGDALVAATTDDPDERSVDIVEEIVNAIATDEQAKGYANGDVNGDGDTAESFEDTAIVHPALYGDLGVIASHYIGSFYEQLGPNAASGDETPDEPTDDARFLDDRFATLFLAELGKDKDARSDITAASNTYMLYQLDQNLDGVTDASEVSDRVTDVSITASTILGAVDFGASAAIHEAGETADATANDQVGDRFRFANALIDELPSDKVPLAGWMLDEILSGAEKSMEKDHTGASNADIGQMLSSSANAHQDLVAAAIWSNIPASELPDGFTPETDMSALTPEQQETFDSWIESDDPWAAALRSQSQEAGRGYSTGYGQAQDQIKPW